MSAKEFWKEKFKEYPQSDANKLAVAMMAEYAEYSCKEMLNDFFAGQIKCKCGNESTGSMTFELCNICGKPIK